MEERKRGRGGKEGGFRRAHARFEFDEDRRRTAVSQESHFSKRNSVGITHDKRTFTGGKGYRRELDERSIDEKFHRQKMKSPRDFCWPERLPRKEKGPQTLLPRLLKTHSLSVLPRPLRVRHLFLAICNVNAIHE